MAWAMLPRALMTWVQVAGAVAALASLLWLIARLSQGRAERRRAPMAALALVGLAASWLGFLGVGGLYLINFFSNDALSGLIPTDFGRFSWGDWLQTFAGGCALAVVVAPLAIALVARLRWGRIWALARLSMKEAVRSRVVFIFGAIMLVLLFAGWFLPYKPEDQVRNYVELLFFVMGALFLMTASLLGAFGIPTDVKSQTIHTIVTKPVEKFEVVLGRFLGYAVLLTVGLAAVTGLSMLYLAREITEEAKQESFTARVPIYGALSYHGTKEPGGENVGRVFDIRGYITGPQPQMPKESRQYAAWSFDTLPSRIGADGQPVRFEFSFDIFRLTKGVENQGVLCTFYFADGRLPVAEFERRKAKIKAEADKLQDAARKNSGGGAALEKALEEINLELLRKHAIYVKAGYNVTDYHTQAIDVPAALFERLYQMEVSEPRQTPTGDNVAPMFQVAVSVDADSRGANSQMLGVARRDLYLLAAENSFFVNFLKGIVGTWSLMMLVLGLAVACSTYLSGIISWLAAIFLVVAGLFVADIRELAENRSTGGGGPVEAAVRLLTKVPQAGDLDETPGTTVITGADAFFRFWLRGFLHLVPDITRFDLDDYVANGFDIPWTQVLLLDNILPLLGYLFPWAVLAFYLMKYREIANPM